MLSVSGVEPHTLSRSVVSKGKEDKTAQGEFVWFHDLLRCMQRLQRAVDLKNVSFYRLCYYDTYYLLIINCDLFLAISYIEDFVLYFRWFVYLVGALTLFCCKVF